MGQAGEQDINRCSELLEFTVNILKYCGPTQSHIWQLLLSIYFYLISPEP